MKATTIEPVLVVDKKQRLNKDFQFNFHHWSVEDEEAPPSLRKMILKNETKANMIFNISADGPFEILKTKTNSDSFHPLSNRPTSKSIKEGAETNFNLQPNKILQIAMNFLTPDPSNGGEWPDII